MIRRAVIILFLLHVFLIATRATESQRLAHPSEIVESIANYVVPRVHLEDETLGDSLEFLRLKIEHTDYVEPPPFTYSIDIDLPEDVLERRITFSAENIPLSEAFMKITEGIEIEYLIAPGRLVISQFDPNRD
ncbi:MAG: hypothetical protein AAGA96_18410 [Verrucomicrobiota bacterium]